VSRSTRWFLAGGLAVALLLAVGVSHWASTAPDGLNRVAEDHGLDRGATPHALANGPLAGYEATGLSRGVGRGVAGSVGVLVCGAIAAGAVAIARRRRSGRAPASPTSARSSSSSTTTPTAPSAPPSSAP
jgi:cobalt/nickel transport system permease protein